MPRVDRLGEHVRRARLSRERLLMAYLTMADPLTSAPVDLAPVLARSGADVLELGLPTPMARPGGTEIAASFRRAGRVSLDDMWHYVAELRRRVPDTPLLLLCYPATAADLGWSEILRNSAEAGIDGIVLTEPTYPDMERVTSSAMHAVPVIAPILAGHVAYNLERLASCLAYRPLAARTGETLDIRCAARAAATLATRATKPFVVGFGIRNTSEIAAVASYAAGVAIGSELLRLIRQAPVAARAARAADAARAWKAALKAPDCPSG